SVAVLAANLAELAGPVGENTGKAGVGESGVIGAAAAVEAAADGPATVQPVFRMSVHAEGVLGLESVERRELVARAPEKFGAEEERIVNGATQRLPAQRGIGAIKIGQKGRRIGAKKASVIVAAGIGDAEVEVG